MPNIFGQINKFCAPSLGWVNGPWYSWPVQIKLLGFLLREITTPIIINWALEVCHQAEVLVESDLMLIIMLLIHGYTKRFNQLNGRNGCERFVFYPWACRRNEQRVDGCCEREMGRVREEEFVQLMEGKVIAFKGEKWAQRKLRYVSPFNRRWWEK